MLLTFTIARRDWCHVPTCNLPGASNAPNHKGSYGAAIAPHFTFTSAKVTTTSPLDVPQGALSMRGDTDRA